MTLRTFRAALAAASILVVPAALTVATPAAAQLGLGGIVYDPTNYAQNVLTAARALQQINNQIQQIQHQATSLLNEARNLTSLPYSALQELQQSVQATQQLLGQAQNIAYNVQSIDQAFERQYGSVPLSATDKQIVADARTRWKTSVGGLQDAMRVQAGVVANLDVNRTQMAALLNESQNAKGALDATQAGNQMLALLSSQIADLTAAVVASDRAGTITEADRQAEAERGREQRRRFLTPGVGYEPGNAQMFYGDGQ